MGAFTAEQKSVQFTTRHSPLTWWIDSCSETFELIFNASLHFPSLVISLCFTCYTGDSPVDYAMAENKLACAVQRKHFVAFFKLRHMASSCTTVVSMHTKL